MALVTTLMTTPVLKLIYPSPRVVRDTAEAGRPRRGALPTPGFTP